MSHAVDFTCSCIRCRHEENHPDYTHHRHINLFLSILSRRKRRLYLAIEYERLGRGGASAGPRRRHGQAPVVDLPARKALRCMAEDQSPAARDLSKARHFFVLKCRAPAKDAKSLTRKLTPRSCALPG